MQGANSSKVPANMISMDANLDKISSELELNCTELNFSQWITRCCFTVNVASLSTRPWQEVIKSRALRVIKFQNKSRVVCQNVIRRQMISFSCHLISLASLFF